MEDIYVNNNGLKEWRLNPELFINILIDKSKIFKYDLNKLRFYSQQDEDKYIIQKILKKPVTDGVFLEAGGMDGVSHSNTKTLEDFFGFTGILIEPVEEMYDKLVVNRKNCKNFNCVVSNIEDETVEIIGRNGCAGIKNY